MNAVGGIDAALHVKILCVSSTSGQGRLERAALPHLDSDANAFDDQPWPKRVGYVANAGVGQISQDLQRPGRLGLHEPRRRVDITHDGQVPGPGTRDACSEQNMELVLQPGANVQMDQFMGSEMLDILLCARNIGRENGDFYGLALLDRL